MRNDSNFQVVSLSEANKTGYVVAQVKFENGESVYKYVRKMHKQKSKNLTIINGFGVYFDNSYNVISINKLYDTKGENNKFSTLSNKIKNEIKENALKEIVQVAKNDEEVKHEKYGEIKTCLECGIPIYLAGPAGSGKNFTVEQIAKELGWNFYFSNSVQQEYKLTGFIDAGGKFHETEFSKACKEAAKGNDVVFFLDEMDASIPEVLVLLNAAIANGYFEFPDGKINFDDKVHFVAAGNTVGSGADEMYTGRMVLDQATLDRFAIIEFDYSKAVELFLSKNNIELVNFVRDLRMQADSKGIRATFSYRCISMLTKLENSGMDLKVALKIAVFKGLDKDTVNTFNFFGNDTKYTKAFYEMKRAA